MLALQDANAQLSRAKNRLEELENFLAQSAEADAAALAEARRAVEIQFANLVYEQLQQACLQLRDEIRGLEEARQKAAEAYRQAFREREILEALRSRERQAYRLEAARREQRELDAAFLLQRWHRE